jgi:hypothetical protein
VLGAVGELSHGYALAGLHDNVRNLMRWSCAEDKVALFR